MLPSIINFWCNLWGNAWCCFQCNSAPTDCSVKPSQTVSAPHGLIISEAKKRSSKQTARSFRCASFRFIRSQTVCIYWKARRKRSKRAKHAGIVKAKREAMQAQSGQSLQERLAKNGAKQLAAPSALCPACFREKQSLQSDAFCTPPVFPALQEFSVKEKSVAFQSQLKTAGTQKRSPFPPAAGHPPFPPS